jgi:hypothetical protein
MKILIALLVVSLLVGCEGNNSSNSIQQESKIVEAQPASRPSSGVYEERLGSQDSIAPLEIKTEPGADYYVKLESIANRDHTMTMYIHGGDTISVEVPLGGYLIKYTSGDTWYGEQNDVYFGRESFFQADETFNFTDTGNQISGYTVTLYQVVDGNLQTMPIDKSQF